MYLSLAFELLKVGTGLPQCLVVSASHSVITGLPGGWKKGRTEGGREGRKTGVWKEDRSQSPCIVLKAALLNTVISYSWRQALQILPSYMNIINSV